MRGFTLVEVVVGIGILGILAGLVAVGYPTARDRQALVLAEQSFSSLLRQAQEKALNEERDPACVSRARGASLEEKVCSDVGLAIRHGSELIMFADLTGNNNYDDAAADFVIQESNWLAQVTAPDTDFVWRGIPPAISLHANQNLLTSDAAPHQLTLANGSAQVTLEIFPYGHVVRK